MYVQLAGGGGVGTGVSGNRDKNCANASRPPNADRKPSSVAKGGSTNRRKTGVSRLLASDA